MAVILTAIGVVSLLIVLVLWIRRMRARREIEQYSITPEGLHALFDSNQDVLVFDVRLPLDLLARSEIIPGAKRLAPKEVIENPSLIPKDRDSVVYCTCPSEATSAKVAMNLRRAGIYRVRPLRGGFDEWKKLGLPLRDYEEHPLVQLEGTRS